jgi:integrase
VKYVVTDQVVLMRPPEGPVAEYIRSFASWAKEQGYAFAALRQRIRIAAGFSRWLGAQGLCPRAVGSHHCAEYLQCRGREQRIYTGDGVALSQFLELLRSQGVLVRFLTRPEVEALLAAPDRRTWFGRRDHAFILTAVQTGLRLSEITAVTRADLALGTGAHVRVLGKGRKERCTPLAKPTVAVLKAWLREPRRGDGQLLFPNARGARLSVHGVKYLLAKHTATATRVCPSLSGKRVTVHLLRHTMALEMLQAGVDRAVIALWLGHESVETTQIYLEATLAMKEQALAKTTPLHTRPRLFRAGDQLLGFLNSL